MEAKFGFKIEKLSRKEDDLEIEDNDVLRYMLNSGNEVWLVAKKSFDVLPASYPVKVSTLRHLRPAIFKANNFESLKKMGKC